MTTVEIHLTKGYVALIDAEDATLVAGLRWRVSLDKKGKAYAARSLPIIQDPATGRRIKRNQYLHRLITGTTDPKIIVDHNNGNGLDCRRDNLLVAIGFSWNNHNRAVSGISGFRGVWKSDSKSKPWRSQITNGGKIESLGQFVTTEEAAIAYDQRAIEIYGPMARTNLRDGCFDRSYSHVVTMVSPDLDAIPFPGDMSDD